MPQSSSELFQVALRIRHPRIDPAEISHSLGIEAAHAFRAGDVRPSQSGLGNASVCESSYWLAVLNFAVPISDVPFPEEPGSGITEGQWAAARKNLGWFLSLSTTRFLRAHAGLLKRLRAEGGELSLLVSLYSEAMGSFTLSPEASRVFADLGIAVEFELALD